MEIKFINVTYKEKNHSLKGVNLKIKATGITGIYGDNFEIIPKLLTKNLDYKGLITIDNQDIQILNRNSIVYINKLHKDTFLTKTVKDEFYLMKKKINIQENIYLEKIISVLEMVGLSKDYLLREIVSLSKSEKRILQIALNLIINPYIIIIDEPFLTLDKNGCFMIKKILVDLKKKYQRLVIILSNDIDTLYELSDYLIIIKDNQILTTGTTNSVFNDVDFLKNNKINLPNLILFNEIASKYNIKLNNKKSVNDLIKAVYKNVQDISKENAVKVQDNK